jgi:hypothetical protein
MGWTTPPAQIHFKVLTPNTSEHGLGTNSATEDVISLDKVILE